MFGDAGLRRLIVRIFKQGLRAGTLSYWRDVLDRDSIVRGIEMYGPEFFFIPNKYWRIAEKKETCFEIENLANGERLCLPRDFLVATLRRPSLYRDSIKVRVNSYMLAIPPVDASELSRDLQAYIRWGVESRAAEPALKAYGARWYSHVYKQIVVKKPFGRVFIPDKVDLLFRRRGVFANYTEKVTAASKNFYIVKGNDKAVAKILTAWFNSTIFISVLFLLGKRISETWTRLLENDYLELPLINLKALDSGSAENLSLIHI